MEYGGGESVHFWRVTFELVPYSSGTVPLIIDSKCVEVKVFCFQKFYIFRTMHLRIILVGNQRDAQFLLYVYLNPLHVLSNYVLILRRAIVLTHLV
jgi:hypothetical protein